MVNTYYENCVEIPADVADHATCKDILKMLGALTPGMRKCMQACACRIEDYFFDPNFQHSLCECYKEEDFNPLPNGDGKFAITAMNPSSEEEVARADFERNLWYVPSPRRGENRRGYHSRLRAWLNRFLEHLLYRGRALFEDDDSHDYYQYDYLDDGQVIYLELIEDKNDFSFDHGALNIGEF